MRVPVSSREGDARLGSHFLLKVAVSLAKALHVNYLAEDAEWFVVPGVDGRQLPIVFAAVVFGLELHPVRVVHRHEDRSLLRFVAASLMVNVRRVDGPRVLGGRLVLLLVLEHELLNGTCEFSRHFHIAGAVFCHEELSQSDRRWDLSFQSEFDQIEREKGREA